MVAVLEAAGLEAVRGEPLTGGVAVLYEGRCPGADREEAG